MPKINNYQLGSVGLSLAFFGVLFSITLSAGVVLANSGVRADGGSASSSVTVRVSSACTMSGEDNTYSTALLPGQETADDAMGPSNIKTICNDGDGYSVYAVGYSNDSYTDNNTKMIGTYANIDTGTASSAGANSYWAMKVDAVTGTYEPEIMNDFDSYHEVPADFAQVARLTSATDGGEEAVGSNIQAYYKVKAAASQVAGSYTGKVKYVLVHPNTVVAGNYTIAFNANGGTGTMESQTGLANYEEQTLAAFATGNITREGYNFLGWCTTDTSETECTDGEMYADEGTIPVGIVSANQTLNLYAVWGETRSFNKAFAEAGKTKLNGYYKMQDASGSICAAVDIGETGQLIDTRDYQVYDVARLNDGKCWMTSSLNLAGGTALTSDDTNMAPDWVMPTANGFQSGNRLPASSKSGFKDETKAFVYNSGHNAVSYCTQPYSPDDCYSYYSWTAATLGSGLNIPSSTDAPYSVCPKGWRLPSTRTGTDSLSDFRALMIGYGGSESISTYLSSTDPTGETMYERLGFNSVPNFHPSGAYYYGRLMNAGWGWYWTSTSGTDSSKAYEVVFSDSRVYAANDDVRGAGEHIRCVFSE